jgi:hypothetical protein
MVFQSRSLLTIDVDAQLRKLPARRFKSLEHYAVELVRAALNRRARTVTVKSDRRTFHIADDGQNIETSIMERFLALVDPHREEEVRRFALDYFEEGNGLSVLALLAPEPSCYVIETGTGNSRRRIRFKTGMMPVDELPHESSGTILTITRKGNVARERNALAEHCRFVRRQVTVNGRTISGQGPPDAMALTELDPDKNGFKGVLWIPDKGDTCRVWLLDRGVRIRQLAIRPQAGLLFHAAIERSKPPDRQVLDRLIAEAHSIYEMLAKRYRPFPLSVKKRVDQLFFRHYRDEGQSDLTSRFAPFLVIPEGRFAPLEEILKASREGQLFALRREQKVARFSADDGLVVHLTPLQWEFLADRVHLSLRPPPQHTKARHLRRLWDSFKQGWPVWRTRKLANSARPLDDRELESTERSFVELLRGAVRMAEGANRSIRTVSMLPGSAPRPGVLLEERLLIFRDHALTRQAITLINREPGFTDVVMPILLGGRKPG